MLRFLFDKVKLNGTDTEEKAAAKITEYVHSRHGLKYNTGEIDVNDAGAPRFTKINWVLGSIVNFQPMAYLNKTNGRNIVNCYDQSSAVQSLCGSIGITTQWLFYEPFGYIGNEPWAVYLDKSIDRAMGNDGHVSDIQIYNEVKNIE